jgi:hypothetical protein
MVPTSLAFAGLFLFLPGLADRLYYGFGFRISPKAARIVGYCCIALCAYYCAKGVILLV